MIFNIKHMQRSHMKYIILILICLSFFCTGILQASDRRVLKVSTSYTIPLEEKNYDTKMEYKFELGRQYKVYNTLYIPCQYLNEDYESLMQDTSITSLQQFKNQNFLSIEGGINASNFQNISSENMYCYSIGLTYNYYFNNSISISISGVISRQNILLRNRETTGTDGIIVYKKFYDHKISLLFLELPVLINYKLWERKSAAIYFGIGPGISVSFYDYSKRTNFVKTNEIIDLPPPVDEYYIEDSVFDNSGMNINACIWFKHKRLLLKSLYINKRYNLKRIDRAHSFSLHIGYYLN